MRRPTIRGATITIWISGLVAVIFVEAQAINMDAPAIVMLVIPIVILVQTALLAITFRVAASLIKSRLGSCPLLKN